MSTYDKLDQNNMVIYKDDGSVDSVVSPSRLEEELIVLNLEKDSIESRIEKINFLLSKWNELKGN